MGRKIKKPYLIENLEIVDVGKDGRGIAKHDGVVLFVKDAVPGDVVDAWVYRKEKKFLIAQTNRLVTPSPKRVEPACQHFGECGGCKFQALSYTGQLTFKEKQVRDALTRIGKVESEEWRPIIGVRNPFWYRNKTEFFSAARIKRFISPSPLNCFGRILRLWRSFSSFSFLWLLLLT